MTAAASDRDGNGPARRNDEVGDLVATYREMLARYVEQGHENQLEAAYVLGRRSFAAGVTLLELLDLHRVAVGELVARSPDGLRPDEVMTTFGFLAEALGTFEMVQRGYREAQERALLEQERATREHTVALKLQEDLLPARVPRPDAYDVAVHYQPGEVGSTAGGDWYDIFMAEDDRRVGFVVGDVTGHGVGAAAAMGQLRIAVLAYALAGFPADQVVARVDALFDRLGTDHMATMVLVLADPVGQELEVANAGHPPPLIICPDGEVRRVTGGHDRLVGLKPPLEQRASARVPFVPGSRLLLYTDGLIEQAERRGEDGIARLAAAVAGFDGTADELRAFVLDHLSPRGAEDDICVLAVAPRPV